MKRGLFLLVLSVFFMLLAYPLAHGEEGSSDLNGNGDDLPDNSNDDLQDDDSAGNDDSDEESDDDSDEDSDEDEVEDESEDDDDSFEEKTETKKWSGKNKERTKEKKTFFDENGNKVVEEIEIENENGEMKKTVKRKIVSSDGSEVTFKIKTETKDGVEKIVKSIEFEGVSAETELEVKEEFEDGVSKIKVELSDGEDAEILVMPDDALETAFDEIQSSENFEFELEEVTREDKLKAVFKAKAKQKGKFLGLFDAEFDSETFVDSETGEVIETNRPWWSFMVTKADKATICHVSEDDAMKRNVLSVSVSAVKAHLAHGDVIGECVAECGDELLTDGEVCELGTSQQCTTSDGILGTQNCNVDCTGFDECLSSDSTI